MTEVGADIRVFHLLDYNISLILTYVSKEIYGPTFPNFNCVIIIHNIVNLILIR